MPRPKPLKLVLAGVDRISAPIERINRRIDRLTRPIRTVTNRLRTLDRAAGFKNLRRSVVAAGLAMRGLATSVGAVASRLAMIGGLVGVVGLAGIARGISAIAAQGDEIAKTADNLGLGIEQYQKLMHVAELAGVSNEKFAKSMSRLSKTVGDALRGSVEAKFAFETLNVEIVDSQGNVKDHAQLLGELGDAFSRVTSPTLKAFLAQTLFSRSGTRMVKMLDLGSAGIQEMMEHAEALGFVMGEQLARESERFVDSWLEVKSVAQGLAFVFGGPLITTLADLFQLWTKWAIANRELLRAKVHDWGVRAAEGFLELLQAVRELAPKVQQTVEDMGGWIRVAKILGAVMGAAVLAPIVTALVVLIGALVTVIGALASPIGAVVLGVVALAAAGVWVIKSWKGVGPFFSGLWDGVLEKLGQVVDLVQWVGRHAGRLGGSVGRLFGAGDEAASRPGAPTVRPVLSGLAAAAVGPRETFDGRLEVSISQDRPPEVRRLMTSGAPSFDLEVETGMTLIPVGS